MPSHLFYCDVITFIVLIKFSFVYIHAHVDDFRNAMSLASTTKQLYLIVGQVIKVSGRERARKLDKWFMLHVNRLNIIMITIDTIMMVTVIDTITTSTTTN